MSAAYTELLEAAQREIAALKAENVRGAAARDHAIAELAKRDVIIIALRQALDAAAGPHCPSCGNSIDPDLCHCGGGPRDGHEGHRFVPMGCVCGYAEPDWQALATTRGEHLHRLRVELATLRARLAGAEAANAAIPLVEHSELNGHIDIAEQCADYLAFKATDGGDPTGKLHDFTESLRVVIDQLDRQRRQRNWYEAAYTAGKQKLIESALDKSLAPARVAARVFAALVSDLGAFVDDNDPRAMAIAGPIGKAQADLWLALGMDAVAEAAALQEDITNRCAVCGWTLAASPDKGCVRGNCSMRPRPTVLYAPERAEKESGRG